MFYTARLKLTAWYLAIIMAINMLFSIVIYININNEFKRFEHMTVIMQQNQDQFVFPMRQFRIPPVQPDATAIQAARTRLITALLVLNGVILTFAGAAGYFLAGRTLTPIAEMVDEQNRFISDASHEFRTPLTALKASLEVNLRDQNLTLAQAKALIRDNIREVNTLQSLSDSLLTLAQYQALNGKAAFQTVALNETVKDAVKKVMPLAKTKSITIQTTLAPTRIRGNPYSLMDVCIILLDNAIKYSQPNNMISVRLQKSGKEAVLSVKDQGIGIAKKDIPYIFDRFYRADIARTKASKDGYGLGLAIAKKIVETHNGTIHIISKPDAGSTFTVRLPS